MAYERKNILFALVIPGLIFLDQLSKYLIRHFGGFYICNKGIAFGLSIPEIIFWIFWLAIMASVSAVILYKKPLLLATCYSLLILSGAISNILDRLYFGCIIDFIDLKFWPVFNLADVFISLGAIMLILHNFKRVPPIEN